ncbi:MAG: MCP four helix bundle domain-containing protein [Deltaproteobacteria bacterium]|nr:MCP four helix bundle domain-containing protein [Deltaproteobacteria bacterium]
MGRWLNLRARIYSILTLLVFITMAGALIMVWYTYRMEGLMKDIVEENLAALQTAEALETALVNQKGFVSYYFLDGDPEWLRRLGEYRQHFKERLTEAGALVRAGRQAEAIKAIESEYRKYITLKDRVIAHYKTGEREAGSMLHKEVRDHFFKVLELCEEYRGLYAKRIEILREESKDQATKLRVVAGTAMFLVLGLAVLLVFVLIKEILGPVRRLALEVYGEESSIKAEDEVTALSRSVRGLMEDMDHTHTALEKSREHLLQAEKMALVGKLAAGTAHSIRNPLTSVKMRLFSLSRTLDLSSTQKEDFDVISEEIDHLDTIVQNFLEFSRPPKLKIQKISPSDVVDLTLQLLKHRLESYDVHVELNRKHPLPEIQADPEQLKEVLVNLIENACESMGNGGGLVIQEHEAHASPLGRVVVIRLTDKGPGIPATVQKKVFEPFFTTKEEGSGLGLSIALRIVEEHGGWLDVSSTEGEGTTFVITLPIAP